MSEFHKGKASWTGRHHTEESKRKISEIKKRLYSEGKIIHPMKGKHHTKEALRKMSEAGKKQAVKNKDAKSSFMKEYWKTHKPPMLGKKHSKETLEKIRLASIGHTPWNKGKKGVQKSWNKGMKTGKHSWNWGKHPSPEALKHQSESHKGQDHWTGRHHTEASLKKMSEVQKLKPHNYWLGKKRPDIVEKSRKTLLGLYESGKFPLQENTKPERQIKAELRRRGYKEGIDFFHQYKLMNKFMCDFCFPEQKVIIEAYGDFWHANPKKYLAGTALHPHQIKDIGKDKAKEAYIRKVDNGSWTLLTFWESDIKKDVSKCVDEIEEALKKKV